MANLLSTATIAIILFIQKKSDNFSQKNNIFISNSVGVEYGQTWERGETTKEAYQATFMDGNYGSSGVLLLTWRMESSPPM